MRVFKTKPFARFARKEKINDEWLCDVIKRVEDGKFDQGHKSDVLYLRVERQGQGTRRGYRTAVLFRKKDKAFFVGAYPRNERDGFSRVEKERFRQMAKDMLGWNDDKLQTAINNGEFIEVKYNG